MLLSYVLYYYLYNFYLYAHSNYCYLRFLCIYPITCHLFILPYFVMCANSFMQLFVLISLALSIYIHKYFFIYPLLDEAAQAVEPSTLIPMKYNPKSVVLVGDPCQLPATVFSRTAKDLKYDQSLFQVGIFYMDCFTLFVTEFVSFAIG